jgi:hypothetical protein
VLPKGAAHLIAGLPPARGRVFSDIDILLPLDRLADAEAGLRLQGWSTMHHDAYDQRYYWQWMHELPPLRHSARMSVLDVHHAILPRTARPRPDSAKLLGTSVPVAGEPRPRVLCTIDMVLHTATHLLHNEEVSQELRDLAGLDALLRHFGVDADFWRELPPVVPPRWILRGRFFYGVRYAARFFGTPVSGSLWPALGAGVPSRARVQLMDVLYERALDPVASLDAGIATSLSRHALYVRGH